MTTWAPPADRLRAGRKGFWCALQFCTGDVALLEYPVRSRRAHEPRFTHLSSLPCSFVRRPTGPGPGSSRRPGETRRGRTGPSSTSSEMARRRDPRRRRAPAPLRRLLRRRRAAGSTRAGIRVHQFDKIETFVFTMFLSGHRRSTTGCSQEEDSRQHRRRRPRCIGADQEDRHRRPGSPSQERYREITSTSNTTDSPRRTRDPGTGAMTSSWRPAHPERHSSNGTRDAR